MVFCSHLCARAKLACVSSRNVVLHTFTHFSQSMLTPMIMMVIHNDDHDDLSAQGSIWCRASTSLKVETDGGSKISHTQVGLIQGT